MGRRSRLQQRRMAVAPRQGEVIDYDLRGDVAAALRKPSPERLVSIAGWLLAVVEGYSSRVLLTTRGPHSARQLVDGLLDTPEVEATALLTVLADRDLAVRSAAAGVGPAPHARGRVTRSSATATPNAAFTTVEGDEGRVPGL